MINNRPVVAFTPFGREVTVSVLLPYLRRDHERGLLDEWQLWMNTDLHGQESDIAYAFDLEATYPWIRVMDRPEGCVRLEPKQRNTGYFFRYCTDPDATYVRFDDDIIYVHQDALENLVTKKQMMGTTLGCFPMIINNAVCSWFLQSLEKIPQDIAAGWPAVTSYCMDEVGWKSGEFAENLHNLFLESAEAGPEAVEANWFTHQDFPLAPRQQFSVSTFAVSGSDYCELDPPGVLDYPEEEHWLTVHRPTVVGKDNMLIGNSFVAHYTFFPHRRYIHEHTNILDRYRALAEKL